MGVLDNLGEALQGAVDFTFSDAVLHAAGGAKTPNGSGGFTVASVEHDCRAKVNRKQSRDAEGGLVTVTQILILKGSLAVAPVNGNKLTGLDADYLLGKCHQDGLGSHWICEVVNVG